MESRVIFIDSALIILKLLKRGFRHCAVLISIDGYNVLIDNMSHKCQFDIIDDEITLTNIKVFPSRIIFNNSLLPITCVSVVKNFLGIRKWWIQTPWQLYRYLKK